MKPENWVGWIASAIAATATVVFILITFAYANFETKEAAKDSREETQQRLVRIEDKLDRVLQKRR